MIPRVDLSAQYLAMKEELDKAISSVLRSGHYILGEQVEAFEQAFAEYVGVEHVVGVADGTRAISMALRILGVGGGDEVITSPFTAIATISAILDNGARPVFVDIDPETYLIDIAKVPQVMTARTRAIVPVHIFGNVVDIPRLRTIVGGDVRIVEDAAQAHGSSLNGAKAGSFGDLATFSFYPTKNLGGYGDGGAIATNNPALAEELRALRNYGLSDKDTCLAPGINSRLDELQAAILRVKLPQLDAMNSARAMRARQYLAGLNAELFAHQRIPAEVQTNWHVFEPRFLGDRDALAAHLEHCGIQTNIYYAIPHHLQPGLRSLGYNRGDLPNLEMVCRQAIALPLHAEIAPQTVQEVIEAANAFSSAAAPVASAVAGQP